MNKFFKSVFGKVKKSHVQLVQDEKGYYICKVYGQFMTRTLTKNKEEAERNFSDCIKDANTEKKFVLIKEATIA